MSFQPKFEYDRDADAVYIRLADLPYAYGEDIDHERRIDYAATGWPIGVELLCVSSGVDLDNLPEREQIAALLGANHIKVLDRSTGS